MLRSNGATDRQLQSSRTCSELGQLWSLFGMRIFNGIIIDYEAGHRGFEACAIFHAELAVVRVCSTVGCPVCRRFRCICRICRILLPRSSLLKLQGCVTSSNQELWEAGFLSWDRLQIFQHHSPQVSRAIELQKDSCKSGCVELRTSQTWYTLTEASFG